MADDDSKTTVPGIPANHSVVHFGPGCEIGPYRLDAELGVGGMAQVFRATDTTLDRTVAIKLMHPHLHRQPGFKERFLREARAVARINHPNVVAIHQAGETHGGQLYMALEFVDGRDLASCVEEDGPMPAELAAAVIAQCCQGLTALHQAGLVHRDIKPANIFLTASGVAKLGDLGLARITEQDSSLTASGAHIGTPAYMSPEQVRQGDAVDIRSDIHALGATLYSLLSGRRPFPAESLVSCYFQVVNDPPPQVEGPGRSLNPVIATAMAKDPADRYQTPLALRQALNGEAGLAETVAVVTPLPGRRAKAERRPLWLAGAGALILLLALLVALLSGGPAPEVAAASAPAAPSLSPIANPDPADIGNLDPGATITLWSEGGDGLIRGHDETGLWLDLVLVAAEGTPVRQRFRSLPVQQFTMGSPSGEKDRSQNEVLHEVSFTRLPWLADSECSRALLAALRREAIPDQAALPATDLSWLETQELLAALEARLAGSAHARLPSEAEWEAACRAGSQAPFAFGDEWGHLIAYGNFADRSSGLEWADPVLDDGHAGLAPVRSYRPNAWGFYDLHGNVWEWCADNYLKDLGTRKLVDPLTVDATGLHVRRGGSWDEPARYARSASRIGSNSDKRSGAIGFRLALELRP